MNLVSFVDELVKLGGVRVLSKRAMEVDTSSNMNTSDPPAGMMGSGAVPASFRLVPDKADSRVGVVSSAPSQIVAGQLGQITSAKEPIDKNKYNRWFMAQR